MYTHTSHAHTHHTRAHVARAYTSHTRHTRAHVARAHTSAHVHAKTHARARIGTRARTQKYARAKFSHAKVHALTCSKHVLHLLTFKPWDSARGPACFVSRSAVEQRGGGSREKIPSRKATSLDPSLLSPVGNPNHAAAASARCSIIRQSALQPQQQSRNSSSSKQHHCIVNSCTILADEKATACKHGSTHAQ